MLRQLPLLGAAALLTAAVACNGGDEPASPASPSSAIPSAIDADGDAHTLKVTPPEPVSPANNAQLEDFEVVLSVNPSTAKFIAGVTFNYRFQLLKGSNVVSQSPSRSARTWRLTELDNDTTYGWRARAELGADFGPWSEIRTFTTPDQPEGYMIPGELYDPLFDGRSVGIVIGSTSWVPGKGIQINDQGGRVKYVLPRTVKTGEFSMLITGLRTNTEGGKTKIMSMGEGDADITTNDRRMTVEKRGNPPGIIAWRFITRLSQIDTIGGQRVEREFDPKKLYLWKSTWNGSRFTVSVFEGGAAGKMIYSFGKNYIPPYDPVPHHAWVGGPPGRGGMSSGSVDGMIVRQVRLSERPRPSFANQ
jgi:hypothetical protein